MANASKHKWEAAKKLQAQMQIDFHSMQIYFYFLKFRTVLYQIS